MLVQAIVAPLQLRENDLGSLDMSFGNQYARAARRRGNCPSHLPKMGVGNGGEDTFRIQARLQNVRFRRHQIDHERDEITDALCLFACT